MLPSEGGHGSYVRESEPVETTGYSFCHLCVCVKACSETHLLVGLSQHKGHCMAELKVG